MSIITTLRLRQSIMTELDGLPLDGRGRNGEGRVGLATPASTVPGSHGTAPPASTTLKSTEAATNVR
ncbi:hypothetical protein HWV62_4285 [Athelia sp. TMB]|nr:hypothetical protein HWV62_4285 [Athelia sp. TMB]